MADMTWEQKWAALNAVAECELHMRKPGDWMAHSNRMEIGGDGFLRSLCGDGATPAEAIEDLWHEVTSDALELAGCYIAVNAYKENRRQVRWNGFMWVDVPLNRKAETSERIG